MKPLLICTCGTLLMSAVLVFAEPGTGHAADGPVLMPSMPPDFLYAPRNTQKLKARKMKNGKTADTVNSAPVINPNRSVTTPTPTGHDMTQKLDTNGAIGAVGGPNHNGYTAIGRVGGLGEVGSGPNTITQDFGQQSSQ